MKKYPALTRNTQLISYFSIAILVLNISLANAVVSNKEKMLLCTSQGYIWVDLTEITSSINSDELATNTINIHKCPFCTFAPDDNNDIIQSFYGPKAYTINNNHVDKQVTPPSNTGLIYPSLQSRAPPI